MWVYPMGIVAERRGEADLGKVFWCQIYTCLYECILNPKNLTYSEKCELTETILESGTGGEVFGLYLLL